MFTPDFVRQEGTEAEAIVHVLPDAATAAVAINSPLGAYVGMGASKRHPKDMPDNELGAALALARALEHLATQFREYAEERIQ